MPVIRVIRNKMKTKKDAASLASEIKKIIGEEEAKIPRSKSKLIISEELTDQPRQTCDVCYTCQACFTAQENVPKGVSEESIRKIPEKAITYNGRSCETCYACQLCDTGQAGQISLDRYGYKPEKGIFRQFWMSLWIKIRWFLSFSWLKITWR